MVVNKSTMKFIESGIRYVCDNYKKRAPGTESERKSQDFMAKELEQWSDSVIKEDFILHPNAFMGFFLIAGPLMVISVLLFFANRWLDMSWIPYVSFVFVLLSFLMMIFEFGRYYQFVDFLFPKKVSRNVYAVRKSSGTATKRIIFGGHADVAYEWTFSLFGKKGLYPVIIGGIGSLIVIFFLLAIYLILGTPPLTGFWNLVSAGILFAVPFGIAIMFFINYRVLVDGANDNMSANYAAMAILKELEENNIRFENTEVCCFISGSEEAGLRGAKAFAKKHKNELKEIETVVIAFETLREIEQLKAHNRDTTGTCHNDEGVCDLIIEGAKLAGLDIKRAPVYPGSTDAAAFSEEGIRAATLGGVNHDPQLYYHTRYDTPDNISLDCIELAINISFNCIDLFNEGKLKPRNQKR